MRRRTAAVVMAILVVVCIGLVLTVAYPFDTMEPHAAVSAGERFTVAAANAFSASGSIVVDGSEQLGFEGVVTAAGAWYQRVREPGVLSEAFKPADGGTVYRRLRIRDAESARQFRRAVAEDEDRRLIREALVGNRTAFVIEANATGRSEPVTGTASVFVTSLAVAAYEVDGTGEDGATIFEPRSGWYGGETPYHLSRATGAVRVNTETRAVRSANVSWLRTVPAGTYATYLLVRMTGDDPTSHRITFRFDRNVSALERPAWLDRAASSPVASMWGDMSSKPD